MTKALVVVDLDGCMADERHRLPKLPRAVNPTQQSWVRFHQGCIGDPVMNADLLLSLIQRHVDPSRNVQLVFVTARPEAVRFETASWISSRLFPRLLEEARLKDVSAARHFYSNQSWSLLMRPPNIKASSPNLKCALISDFTDDPARYIALAVDDRADVLEAYEEQLELRCPLYELSQKGAVRFDRAPGKTNVTGKPHPIKKMKFPVSENTAPEAQLPTVKALLSMAETFKARNAQYKDNYKLVGRIMEVLHGKDAPVPAASLLNNASDFDVWHLYELIIVKLTRFANSGLIHKDSIHDIAVFAAMIDGILDQKGDGLPPSTGANQ